MGLDEIRAQGGSLNISAYVSKVSEEQIPTVAEATAALKVALNEAWAAEERLNELLAEMGIK